MRRFDAPRPTALADRSSAVVPSRRAGRVAGTLAALVLLSGAALCQDTDPVWVPLSVGVPEGTPAQILLVEAASNEQGSGVEVIVHGFYRQDVVAPDGTTYQRITVPGLTSLGQVGAPELPVARFALAVPTDASHVKLTAVDETAGTTFPGYMVYPTPMEAEDEEYDPSEDPGPGDTQGSDEVFTLDPSIYTLATDWPPVPDTGPVEVQPLFGSMPAGLCEVHPVTFNPATGALHVASHTYYAFDHAGAVVGFAPSTKKTIAALGKLVLNWHAVKLKFPIDEESYHSRYLVVTSNAYASSMNGFVFVKKVLGYDAEVRVPATLDFAGVHDTIVHWYSEATSPMDHFVLLVGDTDTIPLVDIPGFGETDDLYGSVGSDIFKEMHVGRLSVDGPADLDNQLQKIISYELSPVPGAPYDRVVLVAHDQDAPFKYTLAHLLVAGATYATPPDFDLEFGFFGATDADVRASIDAGCGLVAYRGHGSTNAWTDWNPNGDDFHKNDVLALSNSDTIQPIVWSFACTNSNIGAGTGNADSIGETWLEAVGKGGVAHYGATDTTSTDYNHVLDKQLFQWVWNAGITTHGLALDVAELQMYVLGWTGKNQWRYMLLGDPAMTVRREATAVSAKITLPAGLLSSDGGGDTTDLVFDVKDPFGQPLVGAQVSIYKPGLTSSLPDELLSNVYTDAFGKAVFVTELPSPGELHYSMQHEGAQTVVGVVPVGMSSAWTDMPGGAGGVDGIPSLVGLGTLAAGDPMTLALTHARPNAPATLVLGLSSILAPFKGGLLVPYPDVLVPGFNTDSEGAIVFATTWPSGVPAGFRLYSQYWIADAAAPVGLAGSNGLLGTAQ